MRACFWFDVAGKCYTISRSAGFAALISSIEALLPPEENRSLCLSCGSSLSKSITQRFVDFLEQMASSTPEAERARRNLYRIRSALLHGGALLHSDHLGALPGPRLKDEFENMDHAQRLVRLVLANWLERQTELVERRPNSE